MIKKYLLGVVLVFITIFPNASHAQSSTEAEYRTYLLTLIDLLQQQIILLQQQQSQIANSALDQPDIDDFESFLIEDEDDVEAWYTLSNPDSVRSIPNLTHKRYFSRFYEIVPDKYDSHFVDLIVYKEKGNNFDGFVETVEPFQDDTWRLGINESVFEFAPSSDFMDELFVHEFAHIISYEADSKKLDFKADCHEFFSDFGCPSSNSHLIKFMDTFWTENTLDDLVETDDPESLWSDDELLSNFVTDYAATNPAEDFAESFSFFVLENKQDGEKILEEKINYFYQFPSMVSLRSEIKSNI